MDIAGQDTSPSRLLVQTAQHLKPGRALDLACGSGRNAIWLAELGWSVTAVDRSEVAIEALSRRAAERGSKVDARVADLERGEYRIEPSRWDLILMCFYLQRDLFEPVQRGLVPRGVLIAIVLLAEPGIEPGQFRLKPGELRRYFESWKILHIHEGQPSDPSPHRAVAEIVVRRNSLVP